MLKKIDLNIIYKKSVSCSNCGLCAGRTNLVFSRGNYNSNLVVVGEGPGYYEDQSGEPFVGKSGRLLDNMIKAMGYKKGDVYICNIVKCRPPDNRKPTRSEMDACLPFLEKQLDIVKPDAIVTLGATATEGLLGAGPGITKRRGKWGNYKEIPVMPTYHPSYCLRKPEMKHDVWKDLQEVMRHLNA